MIQTRPVKVAVKQLFYSIGRPPGIFLSLLPAPQQAIMSCDYSALMKGLYGEKALEGEGWLDMERMEAEENARGGSGGRGLGGRIANFDDEYDQYDADVEGVDYDDDEDE